MFNTVVFDLFTLMQALFIGGRVLKESSWLTELSEMISRLPLNLTLFALDDRTPSSQQVLVGQSIHKLAVSEDVRNQMISVALHGCNALFDALVEHFTSLMQLNPVDFTDLITRFINILVVNVKSLSGAAGYANSSSSADELLDMIGTLYRLLIKEGGMGAPEIRDVVTSKTDACWRQSVLLFPPLLPLLSEKYASVVRALGDVPVNTPVTDADHVGAVHAESPGAVSPTCGIASDSSRSVPAASSVEPVTVDVKVLTPPQVAVNAGPSPSNGSAAVATAQASDAMNDSPSSARNSAFLTPTKHKPESESDSSSRHERDPGRVSSSDTVSKSETPAAVTAIHTPAVSDVRSPVHATASQSEAEQFQHVPMAPLEHNPPPPPAPSTAPLVGAGIARTQLEVSRSPVVVRSQPMDRKSINYRRQLTV